MIDVINYDQLISTEKVMVMSEQIEWVTVADAAAIMGVAVSNVRYLCAEKKIRCQKFGRVWQVSKRDAEDYVRSNRNPDWLHQIDKNL